MNILYIIRGLPGSGKSTLGRSLVGEDCFAADDFFYAIGEGRYAFDPTRLGEAHKFCQDRVRECMEAGKDHIAVANTFSMAWEAEPYFEMADQHGYSPCVIECQSSFGTIHGVPDEAIRAMRERWEPLI